MGKRPHIIIFNPDEMRWDTMGHMGNPAASTPFLDSFAKTEAVSFSNAHCQNPVCVPSRCSFFTGLYPHTTGHRTMGYLMRPGETSLLRELKDAGYYVWANARNDLVAGQYQGLVESHVTELYYGGNAAPAPGAVPESFTKRTGEPGYYSFCNGELALDAEGRNYTADDEDVDAAIYRILHPVDERPLCIFVGTLYPHPPYNVEEPFYSAIDRDALPERIRWGDTKGKSKMLRDMVAYQDCEEMDEGRWDQLRAIYLGMCAKVDSQFERLCGALKEAGIYDDSVIFFLSDHGDYAGDYGAVEKAQNCFEDKLTRVPLLIKPPKWERCDPGITDSMAELVDFYATALDYTGVSSTHTHFGVSLRPVVEDRSVELRDAVFCEGGRNPSELHCSESVDPAVQNGFRLSDMWPRYAAQFDGEAHAKGAMIRTGRWKYIYRAQGDRELYDLAADPGETRNLVGNSTFDSVVLELQTRLLEWYQETADVVPFDRDQRFNAEMIWEKVKNICPPEDEDEIRDLIGSTMNLFLVLGKCRELNARRAAPVR